MNKNNKLFQSTVFLRALYLLLGVALGSSAMIALNNNQLAVTLSRTLALTYFRGCTISATFIVNQNKLGEKVFVDSVNRCGRMSMMIQEVLEKNL